MEDHQDQEGGGERDQTLHGLLWEGEGGKVRVEGKDAG